MKAVIFAAGEGTRMRPLTLSTPKPLIPVLGKPLLAYTFETLPEIIDEVIVIVGYKEEQIRAYLGEEFAGRKITYVKQEVINGTGGALWLAQPYLSEKFLVLNGDDLYAKSDLEAMAQEEWAALVYRAGSAQKVASVELDAEGNVLAIVEGGAANSHQPLINTGVYTLKPEVFTYPLVPKAHGSSEYGLPQTVLAKMPGVLRAVAATKWFSLTDPSDIAGAEALLAQNRGIGVI